MSDSNDKKWFEKVRVNSWEVEILIVAVILAFLFNIPDFIQARVAAIWVSTHYDGRGYNLLDPTPFWFLMGIIKMFLYLILKFCFIVAKFTFSSYVIFRGFWVAVIGLSSVFSKGLDVKKLNYSSYFNKLLPKDSFDSLISNLDNVCSSIFSLGFLVVFYVSSIIIYLCALVLIIGSSDYIFVFLNIYFTEIIFNFIFFFFISLGIIFFIDILFLGILKKVKWKVFSYPYSKLYKLLRILTLFFMYESVYYLFISNIKRRFVFILWLILALCITAIIVSNKADGYLTFPDDTLKTEYFMSQDHYEDRLIASGNNFSSTKHPFINSEIISESYLKLYIPFHPNIHSSLDSACGIINREEGSSYYQSLINCINSQYAIYIDNDTIVSDFLFYDYSFEDDVSIKTFFIPISLAEYKDGKHVITIEKLFYEYYDYIEIEDSTEQSDAWFIDKDDYEVELVKDSDSLIHIPFYIYR